MGVFQPSYKDLKSGETKRAKTWWYEFVFAGRRIRESSKSTRKTIALEAERKRRLDLERGFNDCNDNRATRIRSITEVAKAFLDDYKLRSKSPQFANYALGHVTRLVGSVMVVDADQRTVVGYQTMRLKENASPKSINNEVQFLLRLLEDRGDVIRAKMRRQKSLKLKTSASVAKAFSTEEIDAILAAAKGRRSPHIYTALMVNLKAGLRDAEIRNLQWGRVDLVSEIITVGASKTEAGQGRTIPINSELKKALVDHASWYLSKFGETRPEWYIFPFGKPQPSDPSRSATTFKTAWTKVREAAGVEGRWHDGRHTFITDLAESGKASDETIRQLAGHFSKQMLQHYAHIRMEAKRKAVESIVRPNSGPDRLVLPGSESTAVRH